MKPDAKLDLRDAHVYGGALICSLGAGLYLGVGAGLLAFGACLFVLGIRLV